MAGVEGGAPVSVSVVVESGGMPASAPVVSSVAVSSYFSSEGSMSALPFANLAPLEVGSALSPDNMPGNPLTDAGWVEADAFTLATFQPGDMMSNYSAVVEAEATLQNAWNTPETRLSEQEGDMAQNLSLQLGPKEVDADKALAEKVAALAKKVGNPELAEQIEQEFLTPSETGVDGKSVPEATEQSSESDEEAQKEGEESDAENQESRPIQPFDEQQDEKGDTQEEQQRPPEEPPVFTIAYDVAGTREKVALAALARNADSLRAAREFEQNAPDSPALGQLGLVAVADGGIKAAAKELAHATTPEDAARAASRHMPIVLSQFGLQAPQATIREVLGTTILPSVPGSRRNPFRSMV